MIKTVIFDFDGTIADTFSTITKLFNSKAKEFGLDKLTSKEIESIRNMGLKELFKKYGVNLIKAPFIAKKIRQDLGSRITDIKSFPNIKKILLKLNMKGYQLGILSSNSKENIEKFLKTNGLEIFDFIHSEKNLFRKGKALNTLLKQHKLNPESVIYLGDEVRDIDAAKENGLKVISVTWGFNKKEILKKNKPDYLVDKPEEILKILTI